MMFFKKLQVILVSLSLILTICFPPIIKTVEAAPTLQNSVYYVELDELKGKSSIGDLLKSAFSGLIEIETDATFYESKLKNMTLKKLIQTDNGPMVVTMRSDRQNELINSGTLYIRMKGLSFNVLKTLGDLPWPWRVGTIYDVKVNILELDSSSIQINDLVLDISFDPNEIKQLQQMQHSLQQVDPQENLEEALLLLDEIEGGNLSQQKEAFEAMVNDLPNQEENANQIAQLLDDAEQQSNEIDNIITKLHDALTNEQEINDINEQLKTVTLQFENYTSSLEQIGALIDEVQEVLAKYVEIVNLRMKYLEELNLIDWSESYRVLTEAKESLHEIVSNLEKHVERYNQLNKQKDAYAEKLNQLQELAATTEQSQDEVEKTQTDNESKTKKQLNVQLEEFQKEEPSLLETILEENKIPEDVDIEQLLEEFEAIITEKAEELEEIADDEEKQKAMAKALKETLAQYSTVLINYWESLNEQKQALEENGDAENEQIVDLEIKITVIENIIARIEEFDEELSLLLE